MISFNRFIEEAATKRCPAGEYYCFTDKKCKKMPSGYHVGRGGYLEKDDDSDSEDSKKNGGSNTSNGNGNTGSNGTGGNGGGE